MNNIEQKRSLSWFVYFMIMVWLLFVVILLYIYTYIFDCSQFLPNSFFNHSTVTYILSIVTKVFSFILYLSDFLHGDPSRLHSGQNPSSSTRSDHTYTSRIASIVCLPKHPHPQRYAFSQHPKRNRSHIGFAQQFQEITSTVRFF